MQISPRSTLSFDLEKAKEDVDALNYVLKEQYDALVATMEYVRSLEQSGVPAELQNNIYRLFCMGALTYMHVRKPYRIILDGRRYVQCLSGEQIARQKELKESWEGLAAAVLQTVLIFRPFQYLQAKQWADIQALLSKCGVEMKWE